MGEEQPDKPSPRSNPEKENPMTRAGMALMIPNLLAAGPLVGYGLGHLLRMWLGWGSWIEAVMALLGFAAGIRESWKIIQKLSK